MSEIVRVYKKNNAAQYAFPLEVLKTGESKICCWNKFDKKTYFTKACFNPIFKSYNYRCCALKRYPCCAIEMSLILKMYVI